MEKYAIWQGHKVLGYIELSLEQRNALNCIRDLGLYFGYDHKLRPDIYRNAKDQYQDEQ